VKWQTKITAIRFAKIHPLAQPCRNPVKIQHLTAFHQMRFSHIALSLIISGSPHFGNT